MILIIDVNPFLAALIRDSTCRRIMVNTNWELCFPEVALHKIRKYKGYILKKSGLSELEYLVILHTLLQCVRIIPTEEIMPYWSEAKKIMEHIDPEDVTFIAAALSQKAPIWSDDRDFERQDQVICLKTKDLVQLGAYFQMN